MAADRKRPMFIVDEASEFDRLVPERLHDLGEVTAEEGRAIAELAAARALCEFFGRCKRASS